MSKRSTVLGDLLVASRPIEIIVKELARFEWDSDEELVTLDRVHVISMLTDYLAGRRTASEVCKWAETIEGRDDIGIVQDSFTLLHDAIFQLANPELGYVLSPSLAKQLIGVLKA